MKSLIFVLVTLIEFLPPANANTLKTTPETLISAIKASAEEVKVNGNAIQFKYKNMPMMLVYDTSADRMRLISPIAELKNIDVKMLEKAMEANFHSVLDARYATSDGILWAAFIHPLSELTVRYFKSGMDQVAIANITFGSEYTSGELTYGGSEKKEASNNLKIKMIN